MDGRRSGATEVHPLQRHRALPPKVKCSKKKPIKTPSTKLSTTWSSRGLQQEDGKQMEPHFPNAIVRFHLEESTHRGNHSR